MLQSSDTTPWYKQFWPWFLIFLPLSAVVAGIITFVIAQQNQPVLVSKDYYKEGLAINLNKTLQAKAKTLGLEYKTFVGESTLSIHLNGLQTPAAYLQLQLRHATISQHDKTLKLLRISDNVFQAPFILPIAGKWYLNIRDPDNSWEISREQHLSVEE
ncbi:MAG: FixH family protein [Cycloclasticus sp.]